MRKLVVGDIHGGYRSLIQVLERANFDKDKDLLIGIGDYVDGWPESYEVVNFLLNLPNFKGVKGNHDCWFIDWALNKQLVHSWYNQGGKSTIKAYKRFYNKSIQEHGEFLKSLPYYLVEDNKVFIHGGSIDLENIASEECSGLAWDRSQWGFVSLMWQFPNRDIYRTSTAPFSEVYLGHTTTSQIRPDLLPISKGGFHLIDQGGGWEGKLTLMDIDTHEFWQSDVVKTLYPKKKGR